MQPPLTANFLGCTRIFKLNQMKVWFIVPRIFTVMRTVLFFSLLMFQNLVFSSRLPRFLVGLPMGKTLHIDYEIKKYAVSDDHNIFIIFISSEY